jgi:hypothetical protein
MSACLTCGTFSRAAYTGRGLRTHNAVGRGDIAESSWRYSSTASRYQRT